MDVPDRIADEIDDVEVTLLGSQSALHCLQMANEMLADGRVEGYSGEIISVQLIARVLSDDGPGALWGHRPICEWSKADGWYPSQELINDRELLPIALRILSAPEGTERWDWAMLTTHAALGGRAPAFCDDCAAEDECRWGRIVEIAMNLWGRAVVQ